MKPIQENSLTKKVLNHLIEKSKDLLILTAQIAFNPYSLTKGMSLYRDYNRPYFSSNNAHLKQSKCFNFKNNKFYLTPKGRIEIIKIIAKDKKRIPKWDGKWRGIIFDIPELNRKNRNFLRKELRWIGFKELQKSVWIFPYDIEKELKILLKLWKMDFGGDIRFLLIDKIEKEKDIRQYFGLD